MWGKERSEKEEMKEDEQIKNKQKPNRNFSDYV